MGNEAHKEPTMEEILASIRKIISDDEFSTTAEAAAPAGDDVTGYDSEEDDALGATVFEDDAQDDDVFTPGLETASADYSDSPSFEEMLGSVRAAAQPEPAPEPVSAPLQREQVTSAPEPAPSRPAPVAETPAAPLDKLSLTDEKTADAAAGAIGKLISTAAQGDSHTVEGLVRELLRPLLKEWLDQNLAKIVEEKVEAEVQRIVRMAR